MDFSAYAELKRLMASHLGLAKDALHIYVGFFCLLASAALLRRPLGSYQMLVLGLVVSGVVEALDLGYEAEAGGVPDWAAGLHDLINTNLIPFLLVALARRQWFGAR